MKDIKVSIITVSYNSENTIGQTIESVLHQTYRNIEYIIIDGKSTDNTMDIVQRYRAQFVEVGIDYITVSEKDDGIYDAMNKGIQLATGDIVGIINSDDWYELNAVERMMDTYYKNPFDMFYADLRIIGKKRTKIKHSCLRNYLTSRDWNHPTTFVKKNVYQRFKYENKSIYDDWDIALKIRKARYKIVVLNEVLANFRIGGISNKKNIVLALKRCRERYFIYRRNEYSRFYLFECIGMEIMKYLLV